MSVNRGNDHRPSSKDLVLARKMASDKSLNHKYSYDASTDIYACRSGKKFKAYAKKHPEKGFYDLMMVGDNSTSLLRYLSESDRIKYFVVYYFLSQDDSRDKPVDWKQRFVKNLQVTILQEAETRLTKLRTEQVQYWPQDKIRSFEQELLALNRSPGPIEKKIYRYQRLIKKVHSQQLRLKPLQPVVQAISDYDYEKMLHSRAVTMQKLMFYYPTTMQQQWAICDKCRHCFYRDSDTHEVFYINAKGIVIPVTTSYLIDEDIADMSVIADHVMLKYRKPTINEIFSIAAVKTESADFGPGLRLPVTEAVPLLFPEHGVVDPMMQLVGDIQKIVLHNSSIFKETLALFPVGLALTQQERLLALVQVQEMLSDRPALEVRLSATKPELSDFVGKGDNLYVFVDDPLDARKAGFWYVDRSSDTPKLVQFPLNSDVADQLRYMVAGATHLDPPNPNYAHFHLYSDWYKVGQKSQFMQKDEATYAIKIPLSGARKISKLFLSSNKLLKNAAEDWVYAEASNALTEALATTKETALNRQLLARCRKIHQHLDVIGKDYWEVFPETRGIVPIEDRAKIMQMMATAVKDPYSVASRHYLRLKHRVYHEAFDESNVTAYEPSSFVWEGKQLHYIDEHHHVRTVPMTGAIRRAFKRIDREGDGTISAKEVYELMTRPNMLSYLYHAVMTDCSSYTCYVMPQEPRLLNVFHTGTAQEMICDIRDRELSVRSILYKIGVVLVTCVVPAILGAFGIGIPWAILGLGVLITALVNYSMTCWTISWIFSYFKSAILKNEFVQPELNQLDKMLDELDKDFDRLIHSHKVLGLSSDDQDGDEDLPLLEL